MHKEDLPANIKVHLFGLKLICYGNAILVIINFIEIKLSSEFKYPTGIHRDGWEAGVIYNPFLIRIINT